MKSLSPRTLPCAVSAKALESRVNGVLAAASRAQSRFAVVAGLCWVMEKFWPGCKSMMEFPNELQVGAKRRQQIVEGATIDLFANGLHFPLIVVAVQLGHDQTGMLATFQRQIEAGDFAIVGFVHQPAERVGNAGEVLAAEAVDGKISACTVAGT